MENYFELDSALPIFSPLSREFKEITYERHEARNWKLHDRVGYYCCCFLWFINCLNYSEEFEKHFTPPYDPMQQRICLAPKGDFFKVLKQEKTSIVTGHIETFLENGVLMKDGTFIEV